MSSLIRLRRFLHISLIEPTSRLPDSIVALCHRTFISFLHTSARGLPSQVANLMSVFIVAGRVFSILPSIDASPSLARLLS
uniref:Secreted protein n=1 Tax=Steinernema glaseri TaxID=37863 RepID=A0A1I8ASZ1_9BILA